LTSKGSPNCSRSRDGECDIADCVRPQPLGCPAGAAFAHQDIEHDQQVEIKPSQIDFIHDWA